MKHRNLTHATARNAGWNQPAPLTSRKGGGYPHKQSFDSNLKLKEKKRGR